MNILRSFIQWLRSLFCRKRNVWDLAKGRDDYSQLLINHLETLSRSRTIKIRTNGNKNFWKGEISSMTDAFLFLCKLPFVRLDNISYHLASDHLIYHAKINKKLQLLMCERYVRGRRIVDIKPDGCCEQINVRLLFKNI